jgi:hypothetical protein
MSFMVFALRSLLLIAFLVFVAFMIGDAILIKWRRSLEKKGKQSFDAALHDEVLRSEAKHLTEPVGHNHEHDWRQITEFLKQCRTCKQFEISPRAPTGLHEYLSNKPQPSSLYVFSCPACKRGIPPLKDLPRRPWPDGEQKLECPYCGTEL